MEKIFDEFWENIHKKQEWGRYPSEEIIRFIARNYYNKERNKVKILDFGCGAGANTWFLAREGFDTYAFDGSKTAVEKARIYLEKDNLQAKFEIKDAINISYPAEYFDCVIDGFVVSVNTIYNIKRIYQKIYDILKTGGKIFSTGSTTHTTGYNSGYKVEENTYRDLTTGLLKNRGMIHFFEQEELVSIFELIGFREIKFSTIRKQEEENIIEHWIITGEK